MESKKELMFGRFSKNMILILMGMTIGAWAITKHSLSKLDWVIIIMALFCIVWDFYSWIYVFLLNNDDDAKDIGAVPK